MRAAVLSEPHGRIEHTHRRAGRCVNSPGSGHHLWRGSDTVKRIASINDHITARVQRGPDCWQWTGGLSAGRPVVPVPSDGRTRYQYIHRLVWQRERGPIPSGMILQRRCDNTLCVRPDHFALLPKRQIGTEPVADNKRCRICHTVKSAAEFPRVRQNVDGLGSWCRECRYVRQRGLELSTKYGMDHQQYASLLADQGGACAVCGGPPGAGRPTFQVDHDHATGRVRGLLCHSCNLALGHARDVPQLLRVMADYLRSYPGRAALGRMLEAATPAPRPRANRWTKRDPEPSGMKRCRDCGQVKPLGEFAPRAKMRYGVASYCRTPCGQKVRRADNLRRLGRHAARLEEVLSAMQDGRCAVCGIHQTECRGARLHLDHDHVTGEVRGLLCQPCNLALGHAQDNPRQLVGLADYLERS